MTPNSSASVDTWATYGFRHVTADTDVALISHRTARRNGALIGVCGGPRICPRAEAAARAAKADPFAVLPGNSTPPTFCCATPDNSSKSTTYSPPRHGPAAGSARRGRRWQ